MTIFLFIPRPVLFQNGATKLMRGGGLIFLSTCYICCIVIQHMSTCGLPGKGIYTLQTPYMFWHGAIINNIYSRVTEDLCKCRLVLKDQKLQILHFTHPTQKKHMRPLVPTMLYSTSVPRKDKKFKNTLHIYASFPLKPLIYNSVMKITSSRLNDRINWHLGYKFS
jgi:hypothetical protein